MTTIPAPSHQNSILPHSDNALPPGPRLPRSLQAAAWALRPLAFMDRCHERYGEIFTLRVRRARPWVFLSNPEHIKQVFTTEASLMRAGAGEANPLLEPLLGSTSVMLLDEPFHLRDRKRLLPSFHGSRMQEYGAMMSEVASDQIAKWPREEPFALWPKMQAISLEVVVRAVFGAEDSARLQLLRLRLVEMTAWINNQRRLALLAAVGQRSLQSNPGFRRAMRPVEELVMQEVVERRAAGTSEDGDTILAVLERSYRASGEVMGDDKLRDELVTLLSDGPTATSLAWVFERLLRHPEKLARLQEEIRGGDETYLDAVVKETLRLVPTVPVVMRRLTETMRIGAYVVPSDSIVAPCVYLTHRRADLYPEPLLFRPERFLDRPAATYEWIPFGGGVRRCVAASFAPLEMREVIKAVLAEVELAPAETRDSVPTRSSVSFAPDDGAVVVAMPR